MKQDLDAALQALRDNNEAESSALFAALITAHPDQRAHILRKRSLALAEMERFDEAFRDRQVIIDGGQPTLADFYFAGEYALQAGQYIAARTYFDEAIHRSKTTGNSSFVDSSRLLAALASCQLNEDQRCSQYLEEVADDVEVLWLKGFDRVTRELVLKAMHRPEDGRAKMSE